MEATYADFVPSESEEEEEEPKLLVSKAKAHLIEKLMP